MIGDDPDVEDDIDVEDEYDEPDESNTSEGLVYLEDDRVSPDALLTAATGRMSEVVIMGAGVDGAFWFAASHGSGRADEIRALLERGLAILNT